MPPTAPKVLQVTWNWRQPDPEPTAPRVRLRRAAVTQALVMVAVSAGLQYGLGHILAGRIVAALAAVVLVLGFLAPAIYRHVHAFGQSLGRFVGTCLTYLLLVPFFFLFFLPVALWLRLRGRDPLHRKFRDSQWTYWVSRTRQTADQNIERLFLQEDREARGALRKVGSLPDRSAGDPS